MPTLLYIQSAAYSNADYMRYLPVSDSFTWSCQSKTKIIHCVVFKDSHLVPSGEVTAYYYP